MLDPPCQKVCTILLDGEKEGSSRLGEDACLRQDPVHMKEYMLRCGRTH